MPYSQQGLILASDYNTLTGTTTSTTANQINTVWAVGTGNAGYGQTGIPSLAAGTTVTASQWSTLISTINSIAAHQSSTAALALPTAGTTITYLSAVSTAVTTIYTNRLLKATVGTTVTGTALTTAWSSVATDSTVAGSWGATATFASANAARYFFNAGGRLKFNFSAPAASSTTARTVAITNLAGYLGGINAFDATTNGGRVGTGGTYTGDTTKGYWTLTYNLATIIASVTSTTTSYTSDAGSISVKTSGTQGANGDNGFVITFTGALSSTAGSNLGFDDSFGVTITRSIDVTYPETTNLANSWGTVTIAAV